MVIRTITNRYGSGNIRAGVSAVQVRETDVISSIELRESYSLSTLYLFRSRDNIPLDGGDSSISETSDSF